MREAREVMIEKLARQICVTNGDDPDELVGWADKQPLWKTEAAYVGDVLKAVDSAGMAVVPVAQPFISGTAVPTICAGCGGEIVAVMGSIQSLWVPGRGIFHGTSCVAIDDARPRPLPPLASGGG